MGLEISQTEKGKVFANGYHRVTHVKLDNSNKESIIEIQRYYDKASRDSDINNHLDPVRIQPSSGHFDTYFDDAVLKGLNITPTGQAYAFLKNEVDPDEGVYPNFEFDYKNDSSDVTEP